MSRKLWNLFVVSALIGSLAAACVRGGGRGPAVYLSPTGSDANDCLSETRPCATPDRALSQVEDGGVVHFLPGEYHLAAPIEDLHSLTNITFQGDSRDNTTLFTPASGGAVLHITAALVGVRDLAFDGSDTPSGTIPAALGLLVEEGTLVDVQRCRFTGLLRGILNNLGSLAIADTLFNNNFTGLMNLSPAHIQASVQSSTFTGNGSAIESDGGILIVSGTTFSGNGVSVPAGNEVASIENHAILRLSDSTFEDDVWTAIRNDTLGILVLRNVSLSGGQAVGIENHGNLSADHLTITGEAGIGLLNTPDAVATAITGIVALRHATVTGNGDSGIDNRNWMNITSSVIQGNQNYGVVNEGSGVLAIEDSAIIENHGTGVWQASIREMTVTDSTISTNDALGVAVSDYLVNMNYSTVAANGGGGVLSASGSSVELHSSIIAFNAGGFGDCTGQTAWMFFDTNLACTVSGTMSGFGMLPLTQVGDTWVHPLLPSSPAVDAATGTCIAHDQTGTLRPQPAGGACDVGAYELAMVASSLETTPIPFETVTPTPAAGPLFTFTEQANCRLGPNTLYASVGFGQIGDRVPILGLSDPAGWYFVSLANGQNCFVAGSTGDASGPLDELSVHAAPPLPFAPAAPALVVSTQTCDSTAYVVHLSWNDVQGEDGYRVYRDGALIATLGAGTTAYDDTSPDYNAHSYRVEAFNSIGASSSAIQKSEGCLY